VTICALFTNSWGQIDKYITDMIVKLWFSGKWNATETYTWVGWGYQWPFPNLCVWLCVQHYRLV